MVSNARKTDFSKKTQTHDNATKRYCLSVIQAGTPVHKTHNSALTVHRVHLATAHVALKECAVTKECCIYSLPVVSACNLLNQIYI